MTRSNGAHQNPYGLQLLTIGFCKDLAGEEKLRAAGVERVWRLGNGSDSLDSAIYDFRERGGCKKRKSRR